MVSSLEFERQHVDELVRRLQEPRRFIQVLEVKSGKHGPRHTSGLSAFTQIAPEARTLVVGGDGVPLELFFRTPLEHFLQD